jgi:hypothetical protein
METICCPLIKWLVSKTITRTAKRALYTPKTYKMFQLKHYEIKGKMSIYKLTLKCRGGLKVVVSKIESVVK